MRYPLLLSVLLCLVFASQASAQSGSAQDDAHRKIYSFEHRLIPNWVYNSEGAFFAALLGGETSQLKKAATSFVDADFADQITIRTIVPDEAVLITFAPPVQSPQCHAAIVAKKGDGFIYYTLEKAIELEDNGNIKTMYCAWTGEKTRANYGPRSYDTVDAFVEEFLKGAPTEVQAGLRLAD